MGIHTRCEGGMGGRGEKCFPRTWNTWKDVAEHLPCGEGMGSGGGALGLASSQSPLPSPLLCAHTQDSYPHFCDLCHHHIHLFLRRVSEAD